MFTSEFEQLGVSLVWATAEGPGKIDEYSQKVLENEYEEFCARLPESFDVEESCLTGGDAYEQFAHDYIMTRMGQGVGFWETADWEENIGKVLTELCKDQGMLEAIEEDGIVYVC